MRQLATATASIGEDITLVLVSRFALRSKQVEALL
jgi:hypothetical protein